MLFLFGFFAFIILIGLIVGIFYLLTLQNTLKAISPENRKMEPGMVWLILIPLFGMVWQFIVARRLADSIESEFRMRGLPVEPAPTYNLGLAMCIFWAVGIVFSWGVVRFIGGTTNLVGIIVWILYWIKVSEYKKRLESLPPIYFKDSEIFGNREEQSEQY